VYGKTQCSKCNIFFTFVQVIEDLARSAKHIQMEVPLTWIKCLDELGKEEVSFMTLEKVKSIAKNCGLPSSKVTALQMLLMVIF
jgi:hypothetical protein